MRYWGEDERKELWKESQILYAEVAHSYPCCELPTIEDCRICSLECDCKLRKTVREKEKPF